MAQPAPVLTPEVKRGIVKWIVQAVLGLVGYSLILFLSAGRLGWLWGWVVLGLTTAGIASHIIILVPADPALLAERSKGLRDPQAKPWDRWITGLAAGGLFGSWLVAGLDARWGWTGPLPLVLHLAGAAAHMAGWVLFMWAMASNAYFAETARIQTERGHTTVTTGPYRTVRHPGYAASCLLLLSSPFLLGSWWALIPAVGGAALFVVRTALEDAMLQAKLPGYAEYAQRTRCRLIPGIW